MSRTYAEELRDMAHRTKPMNMFFIRVADALDKLARVEDAAFEAHDCLGGEDEMRAILARVCDPVHETTAPTKTELFAALGELELAVLDLDIIDLVDGWGEPRHRPEIGVRLSANAGQIYRIADALREAGRLVNETES